MENWKAVVGYEGLYEVSDLGKVRSLSFRNRNVAIDRIKILAQSKLPSGYLRVSLCRDNTRRDQFVHALVLNAFVGQRPTDNEAAHRNGRPSDNRLANLRWATRRENNVDDKIAHGTLRVGSRVHNAKLTESSALQIHELRSSGEMTDAIALKLGVCVDTVRKVLRGERWPHVLKTRSL